MKIIKLATLLFVANGMFAQNVNYSILENNPESVASKFFGVELMGAEMGGKKNLNIISMGFNGVWELSSGLGLDGYARFKVIGDQAVPFSTNINVGGYKMMFGGKTNEKEIKVRVGGEFVEVDNQHAYSEKYIMVPALVQDMQGLRAGLYLNKKAYKEQGISGKPEIPYTSAGIYGGWIKTTKTNLAIQVNNSNDESLFTEPVHYKGYAKIYIDAIIAPIASRDFGIYAPIADQSTVGNKVFGGRVGYIFYKNGVKWYDKLNFGVETGVRPIDGFYLIAMFGFNFYAG